MRRIIEIVGTEIGKNFIRTYALLEDGTECVGFGEDFTIGDFVEVFFHHNVIKMRKKPTVIK